jgi:hypothetical protein
VPRGVKTSVTIRKKTIKRMIRAKIRIILVRIRQAAVRRVMLALILLLLQVVVAQRALVTRLKVLLKVPQRALMEEVVNAI